VKIVVNARDSAKRRRASGFEVSRLLLFPRDALRNGKAALRVILYRPCSSTVWPALFQTAWWQTPTKKSIVSALPSPPTHPQTCSVKILGSFKISRVYGYCKVLNRVFFFSSLLDSNLTQLSVLKSIRLLW